MAAHWSFPVVRDRVRFRRRLPGAESRSPRIVRARDVTSKDYADLQILLGDLAYAEHDTDAAVNYYNHAISSAGTGDPERSEIAARAWFRKGEVAKSKGGL